MRKLLPDYMVPVAFIKLDEIPVTSNGKANRKLLQTREVEIVSTAIYEEPSTEIEKELVEIWQEILEVEKIGIVDDFFDLGGHSLLAVQIILRINKNLSVDVSLSVLFEAANIKNLAEIVAGSEKISSEDTLSYFEEEGVAELIL